MRFGGLISVLLAGAVAFGQASSPGPSPSVPVRDPAAAAAALLTQALARMRTGPAVATDVSLSAAATYAAGSDHETGTATLQALGPEQSLVELNLNGGQREQVRDGFAGAWVGADGQAHAAALHNCWTDAGWFAPILILEAAASDPDVSVTLAPSVESASAGQSLGEGVTLSRILPGQSADVTAEIQKLSTMTLYFDPSTSLPVELDFNLHPDNDAGRNIPVEIKFSDYRPVSGVIIPFHIQKYLQHSLLLDLEVSGAQVNTGLSATDFALPAVATAASEGGQQ